MAKTEELPEMHGKGVEVPSIKPIDNAIESYESEKDKRCKISPREIAAKGKLSELLHKNRDKLPLNEDGNPFYRYNGVDYTLEEKLKRSKVAGAGEED